MTPKMKEDICARILGASRQLFLSARISEVCQERGTQKQLEFVLELMNEELTLRDENRRKRLIKRAGFPTYKTGGTGVCPRTEESCAVWSRWSRQNTHGNRSRGKGLQSWI